MTGDLFVLAIVLLEASAALSYAWERHWTQMGVWGFVALSNTCYLLTRRG